MVSTAMTHEDADHLVCQAMPSTLMLKWPTWKYLQVTFGEAYSCLACSPDADLLSCTEASAEAQT